MVLICFFTGCASLSIFKSTDQKVERPFNSDKESYNKSYSIKGKTYHPIESASGYHEKGLASWYGSESGKRTASGARFNPKGLSAAHKTLPIPSKVLVTNLRNGRQVTVLVNDRGPFHSNRLIDLSHNAAKQLGMNGLTEVDVEYLEN
jgi:rare lipoprotein A